MRAHTIRVIYFILFFQENPEFPMMGSALSLVFYDPLFKVQMLAKNTIS